MALRLELGCHHGIFCVLYRTNTWINDTTNTTNKLRFLETSSGSLLGPTVSFTMRVTTGEERTEEEGKGCLGAKRWGSSSEEGRTLGVGRYRGD